MQILFYIFIITVLIQWVYWVMVFARFAFLKMENEPLAASRQQPVSVIICARNEAENLKKNLPHVLRQQYQQYEVIVVNDGSADDTKTVLENFQQRYPHLIVVNHLPDKKKLKGKREALLKGIETAKHEWLVFTDADCQPVTGEWLQYMAVPLALGKEIVLGYSPYSEEKSFMNKLIRYETLFTAVQYFSMASAGMPYMAVGRNMAYTKSLFRKSRNFYDENISVSGDDDLLANELANEKNTAWVIHENSFVLSQPLSTWREWFSQKTRHYSAGHYYRPLHRFVLGLFYVSWLAFYVIAFILLFIYSFKWLIAAILFFSILTKMLITRLLMQRFQCVGLWIYQPLFDFLLPLFLFTLGTLSLTKQSKWKNR